MQKSNNKTQIMGILNATPDSFSGDGLNGDLSATLKQAENFINAGASILDVGGESTRPGADFVGAEEEITRVVPIIKAIRENFPNILISIDTYKAPVAESALDAGANIINDVWGGKMDPFILDLAAKRNVPICLMHNRSEPKNSELHVKLGGSYIAPDYQNFMDEVLEELHEMAKNAIKEGVKPENIILDPGVGFGKTVAQNNALVNRLGDIKALGFNVLLGTSRKSFIGHTLDCTVEERLEGTLATTVLGIARGADIVRVHDVRENALVAKMTNAMINEFGE